jgi:hypothetical protein
VIFNADTSGRTTNKALIRILVVISTPYRTTRRYRSGIVRSRPMTGVAGLMLTAP